MNEVSKIHVGLDVHKDSITIAVADQDGLAPQVGVALVGGVDGHDSSLTMRLQLSHGRGPRLRTQLVRQREAITIISMASR